MTRIAEDDQVLDAVVTHGPATLSTIAWALFPYSSSRAPDGRGSAVIPWGDLPDRDRAARIRGALARLRARGAVRLVGRRWAASPGGRQRKSRDRRG